MAVWSGVNVAGVNLSAQDLTTGTSNSNAKNDDGKLEEEIHKKVVQSAYEIIRLKGYTRFFSENISKIYCKCFFSWAIGLSVASIVQGVMRNSRNVFALTVNIKV